VKHSTSLDLADVGQMTGRDQVLMHPPSRVTKFGVLPIFRKDGKLVPLRAVEVHSAEDAMRKTEVIASMVGGAIAFSKTGDEPTQILNCRGEVPEGFKAPPDPKALEPSLPIRKGFDGIVSAVGAAAAKVSSIASSVVLPKASAMATLGIAPHDAKTVKLASELKAMLARA
jgi:hypothetical protein